jgi:hypothetical protein
MRVKGLRPIDTTGLLAVAPSDLKILDTAKRLDRYRQETLAGVDAVSMVFEEVAKHARSAASGDPDALAKLAAARLDGRRASLELENTQFVRGLDQIDTDHPNAWLVRSMMATNSALIEYLALMSSDSVAKSMDPKVSAARMIKFADEARSAARSVPSSADQQLDILRSEAATRGVTLGPRAEAYLAQMKDSVEVEIRIADHIETSADLVAEGGASSDRLQGLLDAVSDLVDERTKLIEKRNAALFPDTGF